MFEKHILSKTESVTGTLSSSKTESVTGTLSSSKTESVTGTLSSSKTESVTGTLSSSKTESVTGTLSSSKTESVTGTLSSSKNLSGGLSLNTGGLSDYNKLREDTLPKINHVMLKGDKTGSQLSLINTGDLIMESDIDRIIFGGIG